MSLFEYGPCLSLFDEYLLELANDLRSLHYVGRHAFLVLVVSLVFLVCITDHDHVLDPLADLLLAHNSIGAEMAVLEVF